MNTNIKPVLSRVKNKVRKFFSEILQTIKDVHVDNPRRRIHSCKVGALVTAVAALYNFETVSVYIHSDILPLVIVLVGIELPTGKLIIKGLPKTLSILVGLLFALLISHLASHAGGTAAYQFTILPVIWIIVSVCTFLRYVPFIEKYLDDGFQLFVYVLVFILLSPLINMKEKSIFEFSMKKLLTAGAFIIINAVANIVILPSWGRCELQKKFSTYLTALGKSCEACVRSYFLDLSDSIDDPKDKENIRKGCMAILEAVPKDKEQIIYMHVGSWFTRRSRRSHEFPLEEFARVGESISRLACRLGPMHDREPSDQVPRIYKLPFIHLASAMAGLLNELGDSIEDRRMFNREASFNNVVEALKEIALVQRTLEEPGPSRGHTQQEIIELQPELVLVGQRTLTAIIRELGLTRLHICYEIFPGEVLEAVKMLDPIMMAVEEFETASKFKISPLPQLLNDVV